jgi:DNA repair protein NreA
MQLPKNPEKKHPLFNCGNPNCPICAKAYSQMKIKNVIAKENFSSDGVAPFVGRFGYPSVNIGILTPPEENENSWLYDAPKYWSYKDFQIAQIIDFRSSLINSRVNINIKGRNKFLELNQEVSMSSKPVDVDINLKEKPHFRVTYDNYMAPTGPYAELVKAKLTENPKIHTKVQKVHYDTDLKASDAIIYLYENKFDENFLSRILSVGDLGIGANRKLVPTRWSITATDDTLGKHLLDEIKKCNQMNYSAFFSGYLGNYYLILCFPEVWSYELFEMHISNSNNFMTDYEPYEGRKYYAEQTAGGYYTVRLAVLEKMNQIKKQGSVLALRFITGDYTLPLGVWVTREAARKSMESIPIEFSSKELMLEYAKKLAKKKFNVELSNLLEKSVLLKNIKQQSKLVRFL